MTEPVSEAPPRLHVVLERTFSYLGASYVIASRGDRLQEEGNPRMIPARVNRVFSSKHDVFPPAPGFPAIQRSQRLAPTDPAVGFAPNRWLARKLAERRAIIVEDARTVFSPAGPLAACQHLYHSKAGSTVRAYAKGIRTYPTERERQTHFSPSFPPRLSSLLIS
jgi:hypothetical protein